MPPRQLSTCSSPQKMEKRIAVWCHSLQGPPPHLVAEVGGSLGRQQFGASVVHAIFFSPFFRGICLISSISLSLVCASRRFSFIATIWKSTGCLWSQAQSWHINECCVAHAEGGGREGVLRSESQPMQCNWWRGSRVRHRTLWGRSHLWDGTFCRG